MVADGVVLAEVVVPSESQHGQRPVALVTLLLGHRRAPEVVGEEVLDGDMRPQVAVVHDGRDVVEDELAVEAVPVDGQTEKEQCRVDEATLFVEQPLVMPATSTLVT